MMRRPIRVLVVLLTVAVTAGVVWRATANEQARGRLQLASQHTDAAAADAIFELADLRSTLFAYVAPGQGTEFWSSRALSQLDSIGARVRDLEPPAAAANHPLSTTLSSLDGLAAAEKRARISVRNENLLVAGDIVFSEARDLIDSAARDLSDARQAMARAESARAAGAANEQSLLAGALIAAWIFALILLVPVSSVAAPSTPAPATDIGGESLPLHETTAGEARTSRRARGEQPEPDAPVVPVAPDLPAAPAAPAAPAPAAPAAPAAPVAPLLVSVAELCTDIARVSDAGELSPLLERATTLLGGRGVVVWLVAPDGQHLLPAVAHGYDQKLLSRMGPIPVDDHNLTAAAFRTLRATHAGADGDTPGAVAVPMLSGPGVTGVLAAEVAEGTDLQHAEAVASLLAAQLAGLFPAGAVEAVETRS